MKCDLPIILDPEKDLSGCCKRPAGLKDLDKVLRTLPTRTLPAGDSDVLQDEAGAAILDEVTGRQIYDNLRDGGTF